MARSTYGPYPTLNLAQPLIVRSAANTAAQVVGRVAPGSEITVVCRMEGEPVTGPHGTVSAGDYVTQPAPGLVADAFVDTSSDDDIPPCPISPPGP